MNRGYLASGAQADIYRDGAKAIKIFRDYCRKEDIEYEMNLQKMALDYGLPVPEIYNITEIDGRFGIIMEYIDGVPLGNIILQDNTKLIEYLEKSIEIQNNIHKIGTNKFPLMKNRLKNHILSITKLDVMEKEKVLSKLDNTSFESKLCHGDFHVFNLIKTSNGIKIIDWICASSGHPAADVYRTYLLYKLFDDNIAKLYLDLYCKIMEVDKENILEWALIVAGARLGEYTKNINEVNILKEIIRNQINFEEFCYV